MKRSSRYKLNRTSEVLSYNFCKRRLYKCKRGRLYTMWDRKNVKRYCMTLRWYKNITTIYRLIRFKSK